MRVIAFSVRRAFQIIGLLLAFAGVSLWLVTGANRGWTKTSVPVKTVDEVTGIVGIEYQKRFTPGVDFLAVVLTGTALLEGVSLVFRNTRENKQRIT